MQHVAPPARLALLMGEFDIEQGSVLLKISGTAGPLQSLINCAETSPENLSQITNPQGRRYGTFKVLIITDNKHFGNLNICVKSM
jgi:hypothetical protein